MPVFTANIPGPLQIGDRIEIGGKIKENARKMSVNLCAQEGEEPRDVVLHFDVRFHRDNIISLSRKNGIWIGSGNYDTNYNMFVPGTMFRIIFEIKDTDVITIYCQGKFHSNFLPKIPLSMAKYIVAWADVDRVTHCYFHMGPKAVSGDEPIPVGFPPQSPRTVVPMVAGETKRCPRVRKNLPQNCPVMSSNESSDEELVRPKAEGRADKFFYETLMCQPKENAKFGYTEKYRSPSVNRPEHSRKYKDDDESDSEMTKNADADSSICDSDDVLPGKKNKMRRGKFSFAFIGKNGRKM